MRLSKLNEKQNNEIARERLLKKIQSTYQRKLNLVSDVDSKGKE